MRPNQSQLEAGFAEARREANASGYGGFISDAILRSFVSAVATAILNAQPSKEESNDQENPRFI